jgi:hypothetical protein
VKAGFPAGTPELAVPMASGGPAVRLLAGLARYRLALGVEPILHLEAGRETAPLGLVIGRLGDRRGKSTCLSDCV